MKDALVLLVLGTGGITIGDYATFGSGAVITKNDPAHALVVVNPGIIVGWVDQEGNRLEFNQKGFSNCGKYKLTNNVLKKYKVNTDRT